MGCFFIDMNAQSPGFNACTVLVLYHQSEAGACTCADVDIKGANAAEGPWVSVLLRTGVFTGTGNHTNHPARIVVDNVVDAVSAARHRQRAEYWHAMR
jgi:hypothetical protein